MTAEGWMLEEPRHKFVVLDFVDILLPQRSFPDLEPGLETPSSAVSFSGHFHKLLSHDITFSHSSQAADSLSSNS